MKISNCPKSAQALAYEESAGGVVTALCKAGLEIGDTFIAFPNHLLNSVTWVVGWKYEIFAGEERRWMDRDEIYEMNALKRLLNRLTKMGGRQDLAEEFN